MRISARRLATLIGIGALAAGCSDSGGVTRPSTAGPAATELLLASPTTVKVVTRDVPLSTPQSASATVGLLGGQIALPAAGLTVVIPPFAVTTSTLITVTAVAGAQVAYEFEPHGIRFLVPLRATQSLAGTSASTSGLLAPTLYAGYFENVLDLNQLNGTALVSELLSTSINLGGNTASFSIRHFSGYLLATGADSTDSGSQQ